MSSGIFYIPVMTLDIALIPTSSLYTVGVGDASVYQTEPESPTLEITVPNLGKVSLAFIPSSTTYYSSTTLGLGDGLPLPDGLYTYRYSVAPSNQNYVEKNTLRTSLLWEKWDKVFLSLDMMERDGPLSRQDQKELQTIWMFIQGAESSARQCSFSQAISLYRKAEEMLDDLSQKKRCDFTYQIFRV